MAKQLRQWRGDDCCAPMIQCRSVFVSVSGSTGEETSRPQHRGQMDGPGDLVRVSRGKWRQGDGDGGTFVGGGEAERAYDR